MIFEYSNGGHVKVLILCVLFHATACSINKMLKNYEHFRMYTTSSTSIG